MGIVITDFKTYCAVKHLIFTFIKWSDIKNNTTMKNNLICLMW